MIVETGTTRRHWMLSTAALGAGLAAAPARAATVADRPADEPFGYCLNTSTLRRPGLTLAQKVEIAARAGYHALEPWINEMDEHVKAGGTLDDLGKRIRDKGLTVESAIGFFEWAVDDPARREKALVEARRNMEMVQKIGGKRLAAPPSGATDAAGLDPLKLAERYLALLDLGDGFGVVPEAEVWGFSKTLGRLGEAALVAIESGHPKACILPDVYHLYKGGSGFEGLRLLGGAAMHVFHFNDYPADPPRAQITDAARVYPGDGVAPIGAIVRTLRDIGYRGYLSLELFNRDYWKQEPEAVARTGLEKMRAAVKAGLAAAG